MVASTTESPGLRTPRLHGCAGYRHRGPLHELEAAVTFFPVGCDILSHGFGSVFVNGAVEVEIFS